MNLQLSEVIILKPHPQIFKEAGLSITKKIKFNMGTREKLQFWAQNHLNIIKKSQSNSFFWQEHAFILRLNQKITFNALLKKLDELAYKKVFFINRPLEYAVRGSVIDIFAINYIKPLRLDFFGDKISQLTFIEKTILPNLEDIEEYITFDKRLLAGLKIGDYLVHLDHGVGIFKGIETLNHAKYYALSYAHEDRLLVPVDKIEKLTPYIGFTKPKIARLGGSLWLKSRKKAKEDILKFAAELLELYAQRSISKRPRYAPDDDLIYDFEGQFEYALTPSQEKTLSQIKSGLENKTEPIEHVICGDVGFGKTEIAFRIAFKAIANNFQVCLIAPTTILADQHYNLALKRFHKMPVKIALLSRAIPKSTENQTLQLLKEGKIDFIIGTHRLLSDDICFKNLGLLIIDEEQKFGVKQKEKLKELKKNVDVLMLSATPIPRTLNLCLAGIKSISIINDPPTGRQPIETIIRPFSWQIIRQAIDYELKRQGQVFFLHNRIISIIKPYVQLKKLLPQAKIDIIHSKLPEKTLLNKIHNFRDGKIDILLATTIIQNGLDLKNVNTLIVEDSLKLGLADLHQLRGRVGRSSKKAFAYFLYSPSQLKGNAALRLTYLKDYSNLGDGYKLALKDLEIRGAGNILGKEQSGVINRIGFNLYYEMLSRTINRLKSSNILNIIPS